jgi:hypothetical protein
MTDILSGGTNGSSLLTGLTVPIFLTENTVDIGYYSVFDGMVAQKETMINFLFSSTTTNPYTYYFYNTSETEFKKYLSFSNYMIDWGDGTPFETITTSSPNFYSHTYPSTQATYTITMSGMSPWGFNVVVKDIYVPFNNITITNPNGTAYFYPSGGNWSGTPLSYNYLFSGDAICDIQANVSANYTTVPFLITGYTRSTVRDLELYGIPNYLVGVQITGASGSIGTYWGPDPTNSFTSYTINDIDYIDYSGGTTTFSALSYGYTEDNVICSAITKNEALLNVIDEPEIFSSVFIERGKYSALERIQRLNEVDNVGDLTKYGYKFFNIINI